jgi:hypothetical protein
MTLPFRRRHHDAEGAHDRARSLSSREMIEPLAEDESAWLRRHLESCTECGHERLAYLADRELLRGLRLQAPEPPRDLWARTASALDREARRRPHKAGARAARDAGGRSARPSVWRGLPLGAATGALVALIAVGAALLDEPIQPPGPTPGRSAVAIQSESPGPTPITVAAAPVQYLRVKSDGSWELVSSAIDEVCPRSDPECTPDLQDGPGRNVDLGGRPETVVLTKRADKLVIEDPGDAGRPGRIVVLPLSFPGTGPSPDPATPPPSDDTPTTAPGSGEPTDTASPDPTPASTPPGQLEIATGVSVVGDMAYSADEQWLAFSAMPSDGSTGPDLYLWSVGQAAAVAVTTDHATYFSAWHDGKILASRVELPVSPGETPDPDPTDEPGATDEPSASNPPEATPAPSTPDESVDPSAIPSAPIEPIEAHPVSFLLDPATMARTDLARADVWLPVIDATGTSVAYWSGTVRSDDEGRSWSLGTGELVVDGWSDETTLPDPTDAASPDAGASPAGAEASDPNETPEPASADPSAAAQPRGGPVGTPTPIVEGPTAAFSAKFDPTGTRLAVWVLEQPTDTVGRLHLVVLESGSPTVDAALDPLPGAPALRRFSIEDGRLAWVNPEGQDGNASSVQVLAWQGEDFGEIRTIAAQDLQIAR